MNDLSIQQQQLFVEFLTKLAPDKETLLLVRQKPQLKDGELQFHADGAIKCVWPAMLPTKTIKPEWAIYANTASFIIDRFQDGKPAASATNCEYVLVMVLDDVGDPVKAPNTPPLQPTWKMETSPGSYQWGYVFSEQPTKGEFSAAIRAIADAGYTDPGACNPVRNFRIPGSVNLKPNKNGFCAQLIEFNPKVDYTLDEICEAFNVTPLEADTAAYKPIRLHDDGQDDVVAWMSERGLVLRHANAEGWMGVVCPNHGEHTDGNPEGRYNPAMRAYCCLHSHCIDLDSTVFLQWVAQQGGPTHKPGFRDELITSTHANTLAKLSPTETFPNVAAEVVAEVERKQIGRIQRAEWFERFAYIQDDDAYFDMIDRNELSRSAFNALFRHVSCKSIHKGSNGQGRRIEASVSFDENRQQYGAPAIKGLTYAAGETVLCTREGEVYGNRWKDSRPNLSGVRPSNIDQWLDHVEKLIPDDREREHILNVMAYKLQHPESKINHAILHGGTQGCGKDTMWAPLLWAVGGEYRRNIGIFDNETLHSQWGYQLESEIIVLNELREPEAKERRALANKLKPIIAAPPEMLPINRKGLHPYMMVNRLFVLAFTNDRIPISLDSQDRRWFCTWSDAPRMTDSDAQSMWAWFKKGGFQAIARWMMDRDVSMFNPSAPPIETEFKRIMIGDGMSPAEEYLVDLIANQRGEFMKGVIAAPFHNLRDRLQTGAPVGVRIPQAALVHSLTEAGWKDIGRVASRKNPSPKRVFAAPGMAKQFSKSELRDLVEPETRDNIVPIKSA